ncbi:hypothetical protein AGOR_G00007720 [Albula goreensis]|uniref:Uncharacterized protein n=1 Tax=Albula goreensis TaxID=1534307 RepID=A0A8T3EAZ2_9TELE|nr:hypothetical protein AGOR_G00007720 [Albula goreensis]
MLFVPFSHAGGMQRIYNSLLLQPAIPTHTGRRRASSAIWTTETTPNYKVVFEKPLQDLADMTGVFSQDVIQMDFRTLIS